MSNYGDRSATVAVRLFLNRETVVQSDGRVGSTDLYKRFLRCPLTQAYRSLSHKSFSTIMHSLGVKRVRSDGIWFVGISIKEKIKVASESIPASKIKRLVFAALEDYYDDNAKSYRSPHNDASVAKELNCAEAFVAKIREADFGPVSAPGPAIELRRDVDQLTSELAKLRGRIDKLFTANGWPF